MPSVDRTPGPSTWRSRCPNERADRVDSRREVPGHGSLMRIWLSHREHQKRYASPKSMTGYHLAMLTSCCDRRRSRCHREDPATPATSPRFRRRVLAAGATATYAPSNRPGAASRSQKGLFFLSPARLLRVGNTCCTGTKAGPRRVCRPSTRAGRSSAQGVGTTDAAVGSSGSQNGSTADSNSGAD